MRGIEYYRKKTKAMFFIVLFLCSFSSIGQDVLPPDLWYNGEITLGDSTSVVGKLKYDFQGNNLLLRHQGDIDGYTPQNFLNVHFSDSTGKERFFVVKNIKNRNDFNVALFFEELIKGQIKLYTREEVVYYSTGNMATQGFQSEIKRLLIYRYYFQKEKGEVYAFRSSRAQVLKVLKEKKEEIKLFAKKNKLRYSSKIDLIKIFTYYNKLF